MLGVHYTMKWEIKTTGEILEEEVVIRQWIKYYGGYDEKIRRTKWLIQFI